MDYKVAGYLPDLAVLRAIAVTSAINFKRAWTRHLAVILALMISWPLAAIRSYRSSKPAFPANDHEYRNARV